jgi:hypothetical protein
MDPIEQIARGENPAWEITLEHPQYGPLTFRLDGLPKNAEWLRHAMRTDELLREAGARELPDGRVIPGNPDDAGTATKLWAASLAGTQVLFAPVVIRERRVEDAESGHERIEKDYLDPAADDTEIAVEAWLQFRAWHAELLDRGADLGKGSGETTGSESDASSPAGTDSPSTIPA